MQFVWEILAVALPEMSTPVDSAGGFFERRPSMFLNIRQTVALDG